MVVLLDRLLMLLLLLLPLIEIMLMVTMMLIILIKSYAGVFSCAIGADLCASVGESHHHAVEHVCFNSVKILTFSNKF